ncbi:MAG: hypothetical protein IPL67_11175 [Ignavibacteria bacterium]|nr:hypothetical protein [Ignavibacteria bacterium]
MTILTGVVLLLLSLTLNSPSFGQLSGTRTIPTDYATIALAVQDLNIQGVGGGGIVFNVLAGHTENTSNILISIGVNQPTSTRPVTFKKIGTGSNPLIVAFPGVSDTLDGIIKLSGTDFITFDAIDMLDPSSNAGVRMMESGYSLLRASANDGCKNVVIKNCKITLQKANKLSIGIYVANRDKTGNLIAAVDSSAQNNYNKFFGNIISNVYRGIVVISSSTLRDINNEVGITGESANSITNWGGGNLSCEGIRCEGQINVKICNNSIEGGGGTTNGVTGILATLFGVSGLAPNYEISKNKINVKANASTSATYGIRALATGDTVRIHDNLVDNCDAQHTVSNFSALVHDPPDTTSAAYIRNNVVRNNLLSGTGVATMIGGIGTIANLQIRSNQIHNNQMTGSSGTMNCMIAGSGNVQCDSNIVYNNSIPNTSGGTGSTLYGYYNNGSPFTEKVQNNTIYNLTIAGTGTSFSTMTAGIRSIVTSNTSKTISDNLVHGISSIGGLFFPGGVFGIISTAGIDTKIFRNRIYDITNFGEQGHSYGCYVTSGTAISIHNNFVSDIKAPNSYSSIAVIGISMTSPFAFSSVKIYYNSVYLNASGAFTFGSSGLQITSSQISTTATLDLRNNIIINESTPGTVSGLTVAYRRSSLYLNNFDNVSDYNLLKVDSASTNVLLYHDGTYSAQTIDEYKTIVSPRETHSKSLDVTFQNTATADMHLAGSSVGDIDLVGMPLSGYSADYDLDNRNPMFPYIGADESSAFIIPKLNLTLNLQACSPNQDTVRAYLRNATSPFAKVDSAKGYLSPSGTVTFDLINAVNGVNYYLVVKHRNSIETWSKPGGEVFVSDSLSYDFTSSSSQAFGSNMILVGAEYSFYTGDVNNDGIVDAADVSQIDNDASIFASGYVITDLNCDGSVDATDLLYADNNASNFVTMISP